VVLGRRCNRTNVVSELRKAPSGRAGTPRCPSRSASACAPSGTHRGCGSTASSIDCATPGSRCSRASPTPCTGAGLRHLRSERQVLQRLPACGAVPFPIDTTHRTVGSLHAAERDVLATRLGAMSVAQRRCRGLPSV